MDKVKKIIIWAIIIFTCLIFTSGCIMLNPKYAEKDKNGYYTHHYYSCGPEALEKVLLSLEGESPDIREISREIQDSGNSMRVTAALIHYKAIQATWPSEIKRVLKSRGYRVEEINSMSELGKNEKAIILVRGNFLEKEYYHWLTHPVDAYIEKYFGNDTKIVLIVHQYFETAIKKNKVQIFQIEKKAMLTLLIPFTSLSFISLRRFNT